MVVGRQKYTFYRNTGNCNYQELIFATVSNTSFIFSYVRTCREDISNVYLRLPGSTLILGYFYTIKP
ncbi:Uncharacterised protein [Sphingobacterium thalpophilum]|uniref:Uncharacterized protein n=1 Tax=Sphingobacterium thalpophilum TaxID=259 RepID=A0A4U9VSQ2_9SPHI|nr:Uncharacterised protein [Sphingobacterium thalpophilum]